MASHAREVLEDLFTALRADLGATDLSTANNTVRVALADGGRPPVDPPYLLLSAPTVAVDYGAPTGEYQVRGRIEWWLFVAASTESVEARAFAALDAAAEVVEAIQDAHQDPTYTTLYTLTQLLVTITDVFGDEPDVAPGEAQVHGEISYATIRERGV